MGTNPHGENCFWNPLTLSAGVIDSTEEVLSFDELFDLRKEYQVGHVFVSKSVPVVTTDVFEACRIGGDTNPLHDPEQSLKLCGREAVVQGAYIGLLLSGLCYDLFGQRFGTVYAGCGRMKPKKAVPFDTNLVFEFKFTQKRGLFYKFDCLVKVKEEVHMEFKEVMVFVPASEEN